MYNVIRKTKYSAILSQVTAQTSRVQLKLPFICSQVQKDSSEFMN